MHLLLEGTQLGEAHLSSPPLSLVGRLLQIHALLTLRGLSPEIWGARGAKG